MMTETFARQDIPATARDGGCEYVSRVYNFKASKDLQDIYDQWANQFNDDIAKQDYVAPQYSAQAILDNLGKIDGDILDAGCGTGLSGIALAQPVEKPDNTYDVVTCAGTLTHGHVHPSPALQKFIRIAKPEGFIVATLIDDIGASHGYEAEVRRLHGAGLAEVLSTEGKAYRC